MGEAIIDIDETTSDFEEGDLTDIIVKDSGLEIPKKWTNLMTKGNSWREELE
ncbi:MAG: hypothetical protein ACOC1X_00580 [Promethearchaeota archaeon]